MTTVFADELDRLPLPAASRVRSVFAAPALLGSVRAGLEDLAVSSGGRFRLIAIRYDRLPPLKSLIDDVVDRLADLALALFPHWYGDGDRFDASPDECLNRLDLLKRGVSVPWLTAARRLCRRGAPPRPREFTPSVQAAQLALALDDSPLLLALILHEERPPPETLLGLARASEWFAKETGARVVVVVPDSLSGSSALDGVNFDAVHVCAREPLSVKVVDPAASRVSVSPLIGRPNPASAGEMMLAARLERDETLAGLFQYNVRVPTVRATAPLVDLAWEAGKVVVEVDGYHFHSDESNFSIDRRRDYELMISGWLVLRLPHAEVVGDVELAVEKIRDVVAFRRASFRPQLGDQR